MRQVEDIGNREVIEAIKRGRGVLASISKILKIQRREAEKLIDDSDVLQEEFKYQQQVIADFAEKKLIDKIERGNLPAIKFYLERMAANRGWSPKVAVDLNAHVTSETKVRLYIPENNRDDATSEPAKRIG